MNTSSNPQLDLAFDYVSKTAYNVFLTGKAGTGKTTFLHRIREEVPKRMAVVAPTGVAAINAKGVTIHSLFQLPFGPLTPEKVRGELKNKNFTAKKRNLIKSLDLLVIDEISMVRADVLDAIDQVLRKYRNFYQPFGGVQLLMIGDLHQLPPVVKPEEWNILSPYHKTAYFFGSNALAKTDAVTVELTHIYRQADSQFIDLLNRVRDNKIDAEVLSTINSRFQPDFKPKEDDGYITLTSHNSTADTINADQLAELSGKIHSFYAKIEGEFPAHAYPTDIQLEFKEDAQVMFIRNDPDPSKRFYNGKIGYITRFEKETIFVQCPGEEEISVNPLEWENIKYSLDAKTKEIKEEVKGKFIQYPLKLAWAITIHKSQGLTFEKVIIDANAAFAHGQVYVALSRCKTFEGIVLRSEIIPQSVKTDAVVREFTEKSQHNTPGPEQLKEAKETYQQNLIRELFDFRHVEQKILRLERTLLENEKSIKGRGIDEFQKMKDLAQGKVISMGKKFLPHLETYFRDPLLIEEHEVLHSRIKKAATYFIPVLKDELLEGLKNLDVHTDNQTVEKLVHERLKELKLVLLIKQNCFRVSENGFMAQDYIRARANTEIDFDSNQAPQAIRTRIPKEVIHKDLYEKLAEWRSKQAEKEDISLGQVIPTQSMLDITHILPTKLSTLKKVSGLGKTRVAKYGYEIITMINTYAKQQKLKADHLKYVVGKDPDAGKPKKKSNEISLELFNAGKSIQEIAKERGYAEGTIESHLAYFVGTGDLEITKLMQQKEVDDICEFLDNNKIEGLGELFQQFNGRYTYGRLRMVLNYWEAKKV